MQHAGSASSGCTVVQLTRHTLPSLLLASRAHRRPNGGGSFHSTLLPYNLTAAELLIRASSTSKPFWDPSVPQNPASRLPDFSLNPQAMRLGFTAEEVASCYGGGEVALRPEDLIVDENRIDYGSGGSNPLDRVG